MDSQVTEMYYPLHFRTRDVKTLGEHLQHRHSVQVIGMKRVGISNFLRFFLYNKDIAKQYIPLKGENLFIPVDLNNLIEREIFPFWRLTFKRIVDAVEASIVDIKIKQKITDLFVSSIQSGDVFLTFDGVREALVELTKANIYPTLFLGVLTLCQMALGMGAFIYVFMLGETIQPQAGRIFFVTTHQTLGALILATGVFLLLRVYRKEISI